MLKPCKSKVCVVFVFVKTLPIPLNKMKEKAPVAITAIYRYRSTLLQ